MPDLSPKRAKFVQEYLIDLNATAAYVRAGYTTGNADVCGPRLLGNVGVQGAIKAAQAARAERVAIDQDYVIRRLVVEAEREDEGATHGARVSALTTLARHLGMLNDRIKLEAGEGLAEALIEARKRRRGGE